MRALLIATRNRGKQREFSGLLRDLDRRLCFPHEIGLTESAEEDGLEVFETFEENASAKAHWFARRTGLATLADDSGIVVDALDGAPGVRSRRFAGLSGPDHDVAQANNAELLRQLRDVPGVRRTARYRGALVLAEYHPATDRSRDLLATGVTEGRILESPRGSAGFGYDSLFWSDELQATFGEVSQTVKDRVSHRARAAIQLLAALAGR